jgi:membrane-bound ClpP family serine protease
MYTPGVVGALVLPLNLTVSIPSPLTLVGLVSALSGVLLLFTDSLTLSNGALSITSVSTVISIAAL